MLEEHGGERVLMGFEYAIKVLREERIPELLKAKALLKKRGFHPVVIRAIDQQIKKVEYSIKFLKSEIKERDRLRRKKERKGMTYIRMNGAMLTPELYEKLKAIRCKVEEREKKREEARR